MIPTRCAIACARVTRVRGYNVSVIQQPEGCMSFCPHGYSPR